MIRGIVDFALNNRFLILAAAVLLMIWGVISFHNLPVEAYPDIANNYVQIITQWPGRAAEEVEQQVTIPIEIVVNGIPHLEHLRSTSHVRAFQPDADLRRRLGQRLEPAEGAGAALAGRAAGWPEAADRYRLQPDRRDLLVHARRAPIRNTT